MAIKRKTSDEILNILFKHKKITLRSLESIFNVDLLKQYLDFLIGINVWKLDGYIENNLHGNITIYFSHSFKIHLNTNDSTASIEYCYLEDFITISRRQFRQYKLKRILTYE